MRPSRVPILVRVSHERQRLERVAFERYSDRSEKSPLSLVKFDATQTRAVRLDDSIAPKERYLADSLDAESPSNYTKALRRVRGSRRRFPGCEITPRRNPLRVSSYLLTRVALRLTPLFLLLAKRTDTKSHRFRALASPYTARIDTTYRAYSTRDEDYVALSPPNPSRQGAYVYSDS